jgi:SOS-response transcriptional repressor LexA
MDLHETTRAIYDYILSYKIQHDGNSPTMREIGSACYVTPSGVLYHLERLEDEGYIMLKGEHRSRAIYVVGGTWMPPGDFPLDNFHF